MPYPLLHPSDTRPRPLSLSSTEFGREFRESEYVEFKSGIGTGQVESSAVAFMNTRGGLIFVGVTDNGEVRGRTLDAGTQDDIHQRMRTIVTGSRYAIEPLDVDGIEVTVVRVWPLEEGFAQLANGRVLTRNGTRDDPLLGNALARFIGERAGMLSRAERRLTPWAKDDADGELATRLEQAKGWQSWSALQLAERNGLAKEGRLTIAGALFLRRDHHLEIGRSTIELLRFATDDGNDYDLRRTVEGAIDDQLRDAGDFVLELLGFHTAFSGVERVEIPRLPERVVREALVNAVAHRDYSREGSSIVVELRPSALVIRSPGGLPPGVTVDGLREAQVSRNPVVADLLRHYRLAEQRGQGIDLIQDEMRDAMLRPPAFRDHGDRFDVELPLAGTVSIEERAWVRALTTQGRLHAGDQVVLVHATRGERLTNGRVQALLGIGEREARGVLRRLVDAGLLHREGDRGGTSYLLAPDERRRVRAGLSDADVRDVILDLLRDQAVVTNADVRRVANVDRQTALRQLERLLEEGAIVREGERRGTRYRIR
ncbi:MAG: ATP-binding protein [Solirubrobacteraceae bacterium]